MIVVDDFLPEETFRELKEHATSASYVGMTNKEDGLDYPDICGALPASAVLEAQRGLEKLRQAPVDIRAMFLRLSTKNTAVPPHQVHTDSIMGDWTLLVYLQDGPGGTAYVTHKQTGLREDPVNLEEYETWQRDQDKFDAWEVTDLVEMRSNRANILPADLMHRAEPVGGFGQSASDGRIVLVAFFK